MTFLHIEYIWLGIAAAAALVALFAFMSKSNRRRLEKLVSANLASSLTATVSPVKKFCKAALFVSGTLLVFVALARPQWGYKWEEVKTRGIDVVFAVDVSKSMLAEDVKPNRLERAKLAVLDIVNTLGSDRIGLVAFSGQSFLQCPLTLDYDAFRMSLEALDTNVIQRGGTNIAAAISECEAAMGDADNKKIIVLISDGEELESSALERAKNAAEKGVVIYALGVGSEKSEYIPVRDTHGRTVKLTDQNGAVVKSSLNARLLEAVSAATGGFYEPLTPSGIDAVCMDGIKKIPRHELEAKMKQTAIERFQIPLGLAIILLAVETVLGTRRWRTSKGKNAVILAAIIAVLAVPAQMRAQDTQTPSPAQSAQVVEKPQISHSEKEPRTPPANADARDIFNAGVDAYEDGDLDGAKKLFMDAVRSDYKNFPLHAKAFYNTGLALYKEAKDAAELAEKPSSIAAELAQANAASAAAIKQALSVIREGAPLLERETIAIQRAKTEAEKREAIKTSPLADKNFQNKVKQSISACEAPEKGFADIREKSEKSAQALRNASAILDKSRKNFESALLLDGSLSKASQNANSAKRALDSLGEIEKQNKSILAALDSESAKNLLKELDTAKADLQKLLRNDDSQNNKDKQNNQDNKNEQNNPNNKNNQDNQQDNSQNNQSEQSQQNSQDKQKGGNQRQKDGSNADKSQSKQGNNNTPEQNPKKAEDKQSQRGNPQDKNGNSGRNETEKNSPEQNGDETPVAPQQPEKSTDTPNQNGKEELAKKPEDRKSASAAEQHARNTEQKSAEAAADATEDSSQDYRAKAGAMTRREAKQLLDSMKDSEKCLPMTGFGEQYDRFEKSYKDW